MSVHLHIVLGLPLLGAITLGLAGARIPQRAVGWLAAALVGGSFVASLALMPVLHSLPVQQRAVTATLWTWVRAGDFSADVSLLVDPLSATMILVITGVGFLVHVYSISYMPAGQEDVGRFFTYLNLFVFSMLVLVLAGNFLVLFVGWELVGLCSYLLIGFWYDRRYTIAMSNADAGRKAFIVNRVGDLGFILALLLIWTTFGSLAYAEVLPQAARILPMGGAAALGIGGLLLLGATGKSAQLPLFVWLPDAMAGPTPVSALIHAATMVTAGVYMIARTHALFERAPQILALIAAIGGLTALMAALSACVQTDIKRVLAYSTVSQLGYMFLALGVGAYVAGIFHLTTHAFFKALLFLAAGCIIHALQHASQHNGQPGAFDPNDLRQMGGLAGRMPVTAVCIGIGGLALAGVAPLAGFWSKDEILHATLARGGPYVGLWLLGLLTATLTGYYSGRQLLLALGGQARSAAAGRAVEAPAMMLMPLLVLAGLSVLGGLLALQLGGRASPIHSFLGAVLAPAEHGVVGGAPKLPLAAAALVASLSGLGAAYAGYANGRLERVRASPGLQPIHALLSEGFHIDQLYSRLFVGPFRALSDFAWRVLDDDAIDGAVNAAGRLMLVVGVWLRRLQTGYVRNYALSFIAGAVFLGLYVLFRMH
jgi:NADH-quinone oxidoreductase subunit L